MPVATNGPTNVSELNLISVPYRFRSLPGIVAKDGDILDIVYGHGIKAVLAYTANGTAGHSFCIVSVSHPQQAHIRNRFIQQSSHLVYINITFNCTRYFQFNYISPSRH